MASIKSKKVQLGARVSHEMYEKVKALTEGEKPPFESLSDYLTYVIAMDLGRRESNFTDTEYQLIQALKNPDVVSELKKLLK